MEQQTKKTKSNIHKKLRSKKNQTWEEYLRYYPKYKYFYIIENQDYNQIAFKKLNSENEQIDEAYCGRYKYGVTNDIKRRLTHYNKSNFTFKLLHLWESKGKYAKLVEERLETGIWTPFDEDDIRWNQGKFSEWFDDFFRDGVKIDINNIIGPLGQEVHEATLEKVLESINECRIENGNLKEEKREWSHSNEFYYQAMCSLIQLQ